MVKGMLVLVGLVMVVLVVLMGDVGVLMDLLMIRKGWLYLLLILVVMVVLIFVVCYYWLCLVILGLVG